MTDEEAGFSFEAKPRAVKTNRTKYRKNNASRSDTSGFSLMNDPRVIRGTNVPPQSEGSKKVTRKPSSAKRNQLESGSRAAPKKSIYDIKTKKSSYIPVPLDAHLIEAPVVVNETTISTQTDSFADPVVSTHEYVPVKTGVDAETQIEDRDNLFNFDIEVDPVLSVLVSKTLDQALLEVEEEEELLEIQSRLEVLYDDVLKEKGREKELVERAQEIYRQNAVAIANAREAQVAAAILKAKLESRNAGSNLYSVVQEVVFENLLRTGVFYNPVQKQVEKEFLEWAYDGADTKNVLLQSAQAVLNDILSNALSPRQIRSHQAFDSEGVIRISVQGKNLGVDVIGPISVSGNETLAEIENVIQRWMKERVGDDCEAPPGGYLSLAYEKR